MQKHLIFNLSLATLRVWTSTRRFFCLPAASLQRPDKYFLTLSLILTVDKVYRHLGPGKHMAFTCLCGCLDPWFCQNQFNSLTAGWNFNFFQLGNSLPLSCDEDSLSWYFFFFIFMQSCQRFIFSNLVLNFSDLNVVSSLYFPLSKKKNKWPSNKRGAINTCLNKSINLVIQYIGRCSSMQMLLKTICNYWYIHEKLLLWYILALVSLHILLIFN